MKLVLLLDKKDMPEIKNKLLHILHSLDGCSVSILTNCKNFEEEIKDDLSKANIYHLRKIRGKYFLPGDILIVSNTKILKHLKKTEYVYDKVMLISHDDILKEINEGKKGEQSQAKKNYEG
ncbi:MAG: hypothetical protein J7K33_07520 [Candidatus Marinimicrobia bacterium]|nr:hypothetical protein [Candidatus Neomarinimicrobiota bacterium]